VESPLQHLSLLIALTSKKTWTGESACRLLVDESAAALLVLPPGFAGAQLIPSHLGGRFLGDGFQGGLNLSKFAGTGETREDPGAL
jgi:hypothetical protein